MHDFGQFPPEDILIEGEVDKAIAAGVPLPRWGWPVPRPYNGSSGHERIAGWQKVRIAERLGLLRRARFCSICHGTRAEQFHAEVYFRPIMAKSVCRSCHFHIHRRFASPDHWRGFVARLARAGDWTLSLRITELDRQEAIRIATAPDIFAALATN